MASNIKTILLTGGGTAGHVLPNVALLPLLKRKFNRIVYVGSTNPNEPQILESEKGGDAIDKFYPLECVKFRRSMNPKNLFRNIMIPFGYFKSVNNAKKILRATRPDVVFSKGGFVALPVVRAAKKLHIPVVAHESDASIGLANKLSTSSSTKVCTTFECTSEKKSNNKYVFTGSPIRPKIYSGRREIVVARHGLGGVQNSENPKRLNLLIIGGSSGATRINETVRLVAPQLAERFNILHICGKGKTEDLLLENYLALEYVNDIENYLAWADMVVSRAGSNALCELMVTGKPTLFIPLSTGRGDQIDNVREIQKHSACEVLYEDKLNQKTFVDGINQVFRNRDKLSVNAPKSVTDGTKKIFDTICSAVNY